MTSKVAKVLLLKWYEYLPLFFFIFVTWFHLFFYGFRGCTDIFLEKLKPWWFYEPEKKNKLKLPGYPAGSECRRGEWSEATNEGLSAGPLALRCSWDFSKKISGISWIQRKVLNFLLPKISVNAPDTISDI